MSLSLLLLLREHTHILLLTAVYTAALSTSERSELLNKLTHICSYLLDNNRYGFFRIILVLQRNSEGKRFITY